MEKKNKLFYDIQKHVAKGFDGEPIKQDILKLSKSPVVTYAQLEEQLKRSIALTKMGITFGDTFNSLFLWGPTGTGKTEIIKQIANEVGAVYHKLEIQKVPIEELQGFPYLHKSKDGKTVVRLAHPTDLPPTDDERLWLFHLDEFNKADTEDMSAVMNLVLNGEIGGSADYNEESGESEKYRLPLKTVIIGSGNPKEQKNTSSFNSVNNLDIATAERWHRNMYINYDAPSWLTSYAFKPFKFKANELSTRIPSIFAFYILDKYLEDGNAESPFLIPKSIHKSEDQSDAESTMSPRAWTLASNEIIADMFIEWDSLDKEEKKKYNTFDDFYQSPNNQIKHLMNNVYEFGANGSNIVADIIGRYTYFAENRVLPEDVIYSYSSCRDKVKKLAERRGAIMYLLYGIGHAIRDVKSWDNVQLPSLNISTFITDTDIPAEDLTVFIYELDQVKTEASKELADMLYSLNERYKNSFQGYYYTGENELLDEDEKKEEAIV